MFKFTFQIPFIQLIIRNIHKIIIQKFKTKHTNIQLHRKLFEKLKQKKKN